MTISDSNDFSRHPIELARKKGRAAAAAGDEKAALQFYGEVLQSGGYIATEPRFLDDLLRLGDMGRRELSNYRDAAELKIEAGTATSMDIERWQAFNRALCESDRDVCLYNKSAGKELQNIAVHLIALISIIDRLNEEQYNKESWPYVKEFAEQLLELRESRRTWKQLIGVGRWKFHFYTGLNACVSAALAESDQQLLQMLVSHALFWTQDPRLIFDLEDLANQHAALAQILKETFEQLGLHQKLELMIAKCLLEVDLEGLVASLEDQRDEYIPEARKLVPMLHARMTEDELYEALCLVWSAMFGRTSRLVDGEFTESKPTIGYQPPKHLRSTCRRVYSKIEPLLARLPDKET